MVDYPSAQSLMSGPLGGWLDGQVAVREAARRQTRGRLVMAALVLLPAAAALFALTDWDVQAKVGIAAVAVFAAYNWAQRPVDAAKRTVKTGINEAIAGALGMTYRHDCEEGEEFALAKAFRLLPGYDRAALEDRWDGAVEGHRFSLHEAHLEERRGSGKDQRWETVFRGSIIRIAFAQSFHGTTVVARDGRFAGVLGAIFGGRKDSIELAGQTLQAAPMVSPEFEDVFDVYTTDPVEAQWIVHPSYIERLVAIEAAFAGEKLAAVFTGGAVTIVVGCGDLFESGAIDAGEDQARLAQTIAQFQRLADLALALNSNRLRG